MCFARLSNEAQAMQRAKPADAAGAGPAEPTAAPTPMAGPRTLPQRRRESLLGASTRVGGASAMGGSTLLGQ